MKISFLFILAVLSARADAASMCGSVHRPLSAFEQEMKNLVDQNLYLIQNTNLTKSTPEQVKEQNQTRLNELEQLPFRSDKLKSMDRAEAQELIQRTMKNQVAGDQFRYERTDVEIGYCFGRATFVHLEALRLGYKKEQIKKIWAVGPMKSGGITWGYHVTTIVRSTDGTWWVIDPFYAQAMSVREWHDRIMKLSQDQKLNFFVTAPEKFGPYAGKYSREDLGLDYERKEDYYKGYFQDLMQTIQPQKTTSGTNTVPVLL